MFTRGPKEPVNLAGRHKRLRSLNEFEPPYWLGLFRPKGEQRSVSLVFPVIGLAIGIGLGALLFM